MIFFIIFYYLHCIKCKFPDFSLTFPNINFFPDLQQNSLTFAKSGISLTFPWPLDTLLLYMESHISGYHSHAPAQANHHSHAVPVAGQEGVQVEIM